METYVHAKTCTDFQGSVIHNSQKVETTQLFIYRCLGKYDVVYPYNELLCSHKRNEVLRHATPLMNLKKKHDVK